MIFNSNKPVGDIPPDRAGPDGDPWDETTLSWLGKTSMLDLRVTHTERRFKGGPGAPWGHIQSGNPEVIVTDYLPHAPQLIHLVIEFQGDLHGYGEGWLTYQMDNEHPTGRVNVPVLQLRLQDIDQSIRTGFIEALRDSVSAGGNQAEARAFIKFGATWDGVRGGHGRTIDVEGMIVWAHTRASSLPSWALPIGEWDLGIHPDPRHLRLKPSEK